jgi:hypothetical protein
MKNTFILYIFSIIRLYIFNNMFGQNLSSLTLFKPRIHGKKERERESTYTSMIIEKIVAKIITLI